MRKIVYLLLALFVAIELAVPGTAELLWGGARHRGIAYAAQLTVKRVIDGDTIVLSNNERVRYLGVNTPELHHPKKPVEYFGKEAKAFNEKLVLGRRVRLEYDVQRYDRFGRTLAYVYLEDGTFVNAELIKGGYAQIMTIPPNVKYAELFLKFQREARNNNRGLWAKH